MKTFFDQTSTADEQKKSIRLFKKPVKIKPANDGLDYTPMPDNYVTHSLEEYHERRNTLLSNIDQAIVKKAWFTLSHLLLDEHAKVVDMGCDDGQQLFAMAVLAPNIRFVGIDKSKRQINKARELYQDKVHNLEFVHGDVSQEIFEKNSIDAIINCDILHEVYSAARYNEHSVRKTLHKHYEALKLGGTLYIRDFARPPPEDYVLVELADQDSDGDSVQELSEPDLLIWYSEHARPKQDHGCGGFFLEELPPKMPRTRLFRLPYKWAYEFVMRKDERENWEKDLPMEYTFFTPREFRKELRALGMRVQYSGPFWDEDIIEDRFEGKFRLYQNDGTALGHPPTCFIAVARKLPERKSLRISERRPSEGQENSLKISAMRNEATGDIVDIVSRKITPSEILPYHINEEGRLKVYLHDGVPRGVTNAVPRNGINIDDKRWSGHMIEAISVDSEIMFAMDREDMKSTVKFARDHLGLKPRPDSRLIHGPDYYPAPNYIDEKIITFYLEVERSKKTSTPKKLGVHDVKFQSKGEVREYDAQQILNAITVGMIPNAQLEMQLLSLFEHLGMRAETWTNKEIRVQREKIDKPKDFKDMLHDLTSSDGRYKEVKGTTGDLRAVNSIFVEEGQAKGSTTGLMSQNMDFVISDEKTVNTAVVIPITKDLQDDLHAGFTMEYLPIPQRHEGNGATIKAPSFNIPKEVTNMKMLKRFVGEQFGLGPECVIKLGESYYNHIGVTPQRVYPFAIASPRSAFKDPNTHFLPVNQYRVLWSILGRDKNLMVTISRAWKYLHSDINKDNTLRIKNIMKERFEGKTPDWSIPLSYIEPPGKNKEANKKIVKAGVELDNGPSTPKIELVQQPNHINTPDAEDLSPAPPPFHQKTIDEQEQGNKQSTTEPAKIPVETDIVLKNDFADLEELVETLENHLPDNALRPEKW